jgi:hypothetical protein
MLTTEITSLDRKVTSIQGGMITARHAIMEIVSKSRPYMQQFLGVDKHFTGSGVRGKMCDGGLTSFSTT